MRTPWILALSLTLAAASWAAGPTAKAAAKGKAPVVSPMTPSPEADPIEQIAVADQVHTGRMVCELGNNVTITRDPRAPARFVVQMRQHTFYMTPVVSHTGAVRLEDAQAGAMWLQLANKSMLMNGKIGQRMADECQSPEQVAAAHALKLSPPPSLLDDNQLAKK
jgi:hypothetical protein